MVKDKIYNKKVVILGSCVTRDAVELNELSNHLEYYHCRSNIASLVNLSPFKEELDLQGLSSFQRRCCSQDLKKTFRTEFKDCIVVFDFIDDRFPIAFKDESAFTYNPLVASFNSDLYEGMTIIRHFNRENWHLVEENVERFANRFSDLFEENITVLHKANFSRFWDGESPTFQYCRMMIEYYDFLFDLLRSRLSFNYVIDCMDTVTSPAATPKDHKWGHAPFHYHNDYNIGLASKLETIIKECS